MHQAAVVPHDDVTHLPGVPVDARRLARILQQVVQQRRGRLGRHARDAVRVPPRVDRLAARLRVRLDDRTQRRTFVVEAVDVVGLVGETHLRLRVIQRVVRRQRLKMGLRRRVQRVPRRAHVRELCLAIGRRHNERGQHARLRGERHVRTVRVPAFVALQDVVLLLTRPGHRTVRLHVRKLQRRALLPGGQLFNVAKAQRECALGRLIQMLAREGQHPVRQKGRVNFTPSRFIEMRQIDAGHNGAQSRSSRGDGDGHRCVHSTPWSSVEHSGPTGAW